MFEIKCPDGVTEVKQVSRHLNHDRGICYSLEILSIVKDAQGILFLRRYTNCCDLGANGRPITTINDVCFRISGKAHIAGLNEDNWRKYTADKVYNPSIILENTSDCYVDPEIWNELKKDF